VTSQGVILVPVPGNEKVILGLLWTSKKIFSHPKMLLRLEYYESVARFSRYKNEVENFMSLAFSTRDV